MWFRSHALKMVWRPCWTMSRLFYLFVYIWWFWDILSIPKRHCFRVICCDCVTTIFESFLHFPTQRLKGHFCELQIHRYMMTSYHIHVISPCLTEHDRCFTIAKRKRWPSHPPGLVVRTSQKHLNVPMVTPSDDGRSRGSSSKRFHCRWPPNSFVKDASLLPPRTIGMTNIKTAFDNYIMTHIPADGLLMAAC
jgi:hypothetical protein